LPGGNTGRDMPAYFRKGPGNQHPVFTQKRYFFFGFRNIH